MATIKDQDKQEFKEIAKELIELDYSFIATSGTAEILKELNADVTEVKKLSEGSFEILEAIKNKEIDFLVNTPTKGNSEDRDGFKIRRTATEFSLEVYTSLDTLNAMVKVAKGWNDDELLKPIEIFE